MRILMLLLAIIALLWSQDAYADGNVPGSLALVVIGVLLTWLLGYLMGFQIGEETAKPVPDEDEPNVGGSA